MGEAQSDAQELAERWGELTDPGGEHPTPWRRELLGHTGLWRVLNASGGVVATMLREPAAEALILAQGLAHTTQPSSVSPAEAVAAWPFVTSKAQQVEVRPRPIQLEEVRALLNAKVWPPCISVVADQPATIIDAWRELADARGRVLQDLATGRDAEAALARAVRAEAALRELGEQP